MNKYAIIDEAAGHLVNTVLWDGDLATWQPPAGTRAELLANVDLATLPPAPASEAEKITAEEAVAQYFSPYQIAALSRLKWPSSKQASRSAPRCPPRRHGWKASCWAGLSRLWPHPPQRLGCRA
jgi:hypothetical protein